MYRLPTQLLKTRIVGAAAKLVEQKEAEMAAKQLAKEAELEQQVRDWPRKPAAWDVPTVHVLVATHRPISDGPVVVLCLGPFNRPQLADKKAAWEAAEQTRLEQAEAAQRARRKKAATVMNGAVQVRVHDG
eukprot:SAG22_NODE_4151_length_1367_cov_1.256309_2_plen_131_part_00